jgi:hypothetical protein
MDKNYSNNLQINAIAQYLGLHPNHLIMDGKRMCLQ